MPPFRLASLALIAGLLATTSAVHAAVTTAYPIVFVTQVPVPADFTTIASVFGNSARTCNRRRAAATCGYAMPTARCAT